MRGLVALDPDLVVTRRGRTLSLAPAGRPAFEVPAGESSGTAGDAVASLGVEAARASEALRRAGPAAMTRAGFEEVFNHLDPYSRYVTADEARAARERRLGAAELGLTLTTAAGNAVAVEAVTPGGVAALAGLRPGDRVLEVDGIAVAGSRLGEALRLLDGAPGSTVVLRVRRGRQVLVVAPVRTAAAPLAVTGELREGILLIRLPVFSAATGAQLEAILRRDADAASRGIVLDLRGNRGGLLPQAVEVADAFLPVGTVALTDGRHPESRRRLLSSGGDLTDGRPVVVLVDGRSASAAEIVAAALADRRRAVVVGSTTLGKGLIQILIPLPNGAELALSWSRILAPRGWPLQGLGVVPSVCTNLGAEETRRALAGLTRGENAMAVPLALSRAVRASSPASEVAALRGACPPAEGREADLAVARALLERPEAYRAALLP